MPDVLITENIIGEEMDVLRRDFDALFDPDLWKQPEKLQAMIPDFRALIVRNQTQVTRDLIEAGTNLQIIGRAGVGLDNVDLQAATDRGVVVAFTPEQNTNSVAELVIGLIISLSRKIPAADNGTRKGAWDRHQFTGAEVLGKTLGVVGFGRIGASSAIKARALGMDIIAYDPFVDAESLKAMESRARMASLEDVLREADFVSCHLPATKETSGLFDYDKFRQMKPGAFFINTSRGDVVDENGLIRALGEKLIAGAALDVRQNEPPERSPLDEMENVILTPHIGAFTLEAQRRVVTAVCRDVAAVLNGGTAKNFANLPKPKR
ncbi:MAG: hydroxyacid dehydrogenase [Acidobacteria bacterium]|nr:hydroxyacid dehydrogenase [Acidobacteriota bacterium]